jgi:biotin-dependent carboxylase-like uncharacterized protein
MSAIHVISPGFLTSVQDLGRPGYAHLGISPSGAADAFSLRYGNRLVGNQEGAAALEMTLVGGEFQFDKGAIITATGSNFGIPPNQVFWVTPGETVRFGPTRSGARCYLCIRGGLDVPLTFGSASAHLMTGVGGRPLKKGDTLAIGNAVKGGVRKLRKPAARDRSVLRVTAAPQRDWFLGPLGVYEVSEKCDRMGIRLTGEPVKRAHTRELLTEGVSLGAIQIPPDGQPIILFVEHQTTGGYPKIANVISADVPAAGQLRPRDAVKFEEVSLEVAVALLRRQEEFLRSLST